MHCDEELTQYLQDILDDNTGFSDRNELVTTSIPEERIPEEAIPETRLPAETVVSVSEGTQAISKGASTSINNSTPIPSPVPVHDDPRGNEFCYARKYSKKLYLKKIKVSRRCTNCMLNGMIPIKIVIKPTNVNTGPLQMLIPT